MPAQFATLVMFCSLPLATRGWQRRRLAAGGGIYSRSLPTTSLFGDVVAAVAAIK